MALETIPHAALLATAHALAAASAEAIRPHFRCAMQIDNKAEAGKFDPVTVADRAAERAILEHLRRAWPEHGIEGEEYGAHAGASPYRWIIDPIDGTRAFILGLPTWGTLIGLVHGESPVFGMMNQPFTSERFWSGETAAMFRGPDGMEHSLKARKCPALAEAMFMTTAPELFKTDAERSGFEAIRAATRSTRYGGDCYAYCMLAAGHVDLVVEAGLQSYDISPLIPIIEGAGGVCTSWSGGSAARGGNVIAAGDARVHAAALEILNRVG